MREHLIILVDDDEIINDVHAKHVSLKLPESKIISFVNPEQAIEYLNELDHDPDRFIDIILDLNFPDYFGLEFIETIEEHELEELHNLTIHILSEYEVVQVREKMKVFPFIAGYAQKPLSNKFIEVLKKSA